MEVSTVGDRPLDQAAEALVMASREAMVNAARHSGVDRVFILAETDSAGARVVVKDRGVGFDLAMVPADRRGISESIVGRLERAGGKASVRATAGEGVEVDMWIPT
jgi:signal transduction histidine kinase